MAHFLTMTTTMQCPHGGSVQPVTSNSKVKADGQFVLRSTDTFVIAGCPYVRGTTPNPCVRVQWDTHCEHHNSDRDPSLNEDSIGNCLDASGGMQGIVDIVSTQEKGAGT
jgi:hypothetical protein